MGQRYTKPVNVLTGPKTFSGGEEFAYDIRTQKRGTLVGEVTGGGANPGEYVPLARGFIAFVPTGRSINPLTTKKRDKEAALSLMTKVLKRHGSTEAITTDGLASYKAATKMLGNTAKQDIGRWANNRVENSHRPFRRRERPMLRFRKIKSLQKFASVHANVHNHFNH